MQQLREAIQNKYGVSSETSGQVINALTEIEKHRQVAAGGQLPGRPGVAQGGQVPNIESIVGGLMGGSSAQGGGMLGMILSILRRLLRMGGGNPSQGGQNVMNILSDLMGGATHPSQAPELASILNGLLSSGTGGASGGQGVNVEALVTSLLAGQMPTQSRQTTPTSQKPR